MTELILLKCSLIILGIKLVYLIRYRRRSETKRRRSRGVTIGLRTPTVAKDIKLATISAMWYFKTRVLVKLDINLHL